MKSLLSCFALLALCSIPCVSQIAGYPDFEIVESIPAETILDNPDIRNTKEVWLEMINGSRTTLDFEEFYISNEPGEELEPVLKAIVAAAHRGVRVRFIIDAGMYKTYPGMADSLGRQPNIALRTIDYHKLAGGIQHAKYFTVDNCAVFVGSQNFDWRALNQIHELGVRIKNNEAAKIYQDAFNVDWALAENNDPAEIPRYLHHTTYALPIRIAEGPGDTLVYTPTYSPFVLDPDTALWDETKMVRVIDGARRDLMLQFLTYSPLSYGKGYYATLNESLIRAARRGVHVHLIISDWERSPKQIAELKKLAAVPGIEVRFSSIPDLPHRYISYARVEHCKYIVADSTSCWLGSANAEKSYFYNTRNVGVVVCNSRIAGILRRVFLQDWTGPYTVPVTQNGTYPVKEHGERK